MWLRVHLSIAPKERMLRYKSTKKICGSHSSLVPVVPQCGGGFRQGIGYIEQALVWWNDADPHSSRLTKDYFGAFWTLPRTHNNFWVSSFIYLLCFPSNEAQERDVYSCFWPLSEGQEKEGCERVCMLECVTVAWTIIAFVTYPKAPLLLLLNFHL